MTETVTELLGPGPAAGLAGLLDQPVPGDDAVLPPLWHCVYLLNRPAQAALGPDGHAVAVLAAPPGPGLQRMWAGGRITDHGILRLGRPATRTSRIASTKERTGRSGRLTIVTTRGVITQDGQVCIVDEQDIVYREPSRLTSVAADPVPAPAGRRVEVTQPLLFCFSALTYNAHRIHYDVDYCREVEGYDDLVVHGPLEALLMSEQARSSTPPDGPTTFSYRLMAPLLLGQGLVVHAEQTGDAMRTTVTDDAGGQTATGTRTRAS